MEVSWRVLLTKCNCAKEWPLYFRFAIVLRLVNTTSQRFLLKSWTNWFWFSGGFSTGKDETEFEEKFRQAAWKTNGGWGTLMAKRGNSTKRWSDSKWHYSAGGKRNCSIDSKSKSASAVVSTAVYLLLVQVRLIEKERVFVSSTSSVCRQKVSKANDFFMHVRSIRRWRNAIMRRIGVKSTSLSLWRLEIRFLYGLSNFSVKAPVMFPCRPDNDIFVELYSQPAEPMKKVIRWALSNFSQRFCARDSTMAANVSFDSKVPHAIRRRPAVHHRPTTGRQNQDQVWSNVIDIWWRRRVQRT